MHRISRMGLAIAVRKLINIKKDDLGINISTVKKLSFTTFFRVLVHSIILFATFSCGSSEQNQCFSLGKLQDESFVSIIHDLENSSVDEALSYQRQVFSLSNWFYDFVDSRLDRGSNELRGRSLHSGEFDETKISFVLMFKLIPQYCSAFSVQSNHATVIIHHCFQYCWAISLGFTFVENLKENAPSVC